jgi:hypothetical protein
MQDPHVIHYHLFTPTQRPLSLPFPSSLPNQPRLGSSGAPLLSRSATDVHGRDGEPTLRWRPRRRRLGSPAAATATTATWSGGRAEQGAAAEALLSSSGFLFFGLRAWRAASSSSAGGGLEFSEQKRITTGSGAVARPLPLSFLRQLLRRRPPARPANAEEKGRRSSGAASSQAPAAGRRDGELCMADEYELRRQDDGLCVAPRRPDLDGEEAGNQGVAGSPAPSVASMVGGAGPWASVMRRPSSGEEQRRPALLRALLSFNVAGGTTPSSSLLCCPRRRPCHAMARGSNRQTRGGPTRERSARVVPRCIWGMLDANGTSRSLYRPPVQRFGALPAYCRSRTVAGSAPSATSLRAEL